MANVMPMPTAVPRAQPPAVRQQYIELKGNAINMTNTLTVDIEGEDKPALVADWITRMVFA